MLLIASAAVVNRVWLICKMLCRGGPKASAHVEALANVNVMRDVLKVAAGVGHTLGDEIASDIPNIAALVNCFEDDTC